MINTTQLALAVSTLASVGSEVHHQAQELLNRYQQRIDRDILTFLTHPPSPMGLLEFEHRLTASLRELGRELVEGVCNRLEADAPNSLPSQSIGLLRPRRNSRWTRFLARSAFGDTFIARWPGTQGKSRSPR